MAVSRWSIVLLAVFTAVLLEYRANAESDPLPSEAASTPARAAFILQDLDRPEPGETWFSQHFCRVGISGKYGLTYTKRLEAGGKRLRLRFGGPVLRKLNRMGLSFEVRF